MLSVFNQYYLAKSPSTFFSVFAGRVEFASLLYYFEAIVLIIKRLINGLLAVNAVALQTVALPVKYVALDV